MKIKRNVAVDKKSSFIFCTQFGAQNAGNGISELPDFKILGWGSIPGGGGVLPYMGYIGTCRGIGYGFLGSRSLNRVSFLTLLLLCS